MPFPPHCKPTAIAVSEVRSLTALQMLTIPLLLSTGLFLGCLIAYVGIDYGANKLADMVWPSTAETYTQK